MQLFIAFLRKNDLYLYYLAFALLLLSFLINLGSHHIFVHTDEPRRALVAMEMIMSGDYITPTLNGEYYYNKPPLYNWIMIAYFKVLGSYSEFTLRLPVVIAIMLYSLTIVYFSKKHLDFRTSLLIGLSFATCGRILFYDSFLGLIDTTFSWVIYTGLMVIYHSYEEKKWYRLFLLSYLLASIAFLMKGLPALAFQGISLLAFFLYRRSFKKLFSLPHVLGGMVFLSVVGIYYYLYFRSNPTPPQELFLNIWTESAKRTGLRFGLWEVIIHLFEFPFETLKDFAPWTLLLLLFLRKGILKEIKKHPFVAFNAFMFLANIIPYWTSPEVYPRYLFVFVPLANTVALYFFSVTPAESWRRRTVEYIFGGILVISAFLPLIFPFSDRLNDFDYLYSKISFLVVSLGLVSMLYWKLPASRLVMLVLGMGVMRMAFAWFILPKRDYQLIPLKGEAIRVAELTHGEELFLYENTPIHDGTSYYISREREEILYRKRAVASGDTSYFIVGDQQLAGLEGYTHYYTFRTTHYDGHLHLIKLAAEKNDENDP